MEMDVRIGGREGKGDVSVAEKDSRAVGSRALDVALAGFALLLLGGLFLILGALVRASSPGPVLHRQRRVGRGGRAFVMYKFRTMRVSPAGPWVTAADDPRVTRIGAVLRRWKVDELPQLWNVLRGDMSLIGPRPEVEKFVRCYTPEQRAILRAKPGLAGMGQLLFPGEAELLRGCCDPDATYVEQLMPRKLAADLEYERRRTLATDLALMARIALLVLRPGRDEAVPAGVRRQHA
jgi:lipopolysaccharide/colanic/teichoic acid biosynthesis glycosyltransferase